MSPIYHKELAAGQWQTLTLMQQSAHVGSEVERATNLLTPLTTPRNQVVR